nr:hypothetical protein [Tanacetum cinerariifolium]
MRAFICNFQTTNEILFKERNNSLIELRFGVQELLKVINNTPMINCEVKRVTTRGGKTTTQDTQNNDDRIHIEEPHTINHNKLTESNEVLTNDQPQEARLGEPKATRMSLELADRSIQYPRGIIENVLINVDKFVLQIDFIILDMPEDSRVPIIFGRPFLATTRAMIDVFNKKITLRVGDDKMIFDVDQSIKRPTIDDDECYGINDLFDTINTKAQEFLANDEPDSFLLRGLEKSIDQSDLEECEPVECNKRYDSDKSIRRIR